MCEPTLIIAGLSAGMSMAGGFAQAQQGRAEARGYRMQAAQAMQAANVEANQVRAQGERDLSTTRVIQAASGVDMAGGSAADVGGKQASVIEEEALMRLYAGRVGRWQNLALAAQAKANARNAAIGGVLTGVTTLLGGGTGPADGTRATTCTPGPWHIARMLEAAEDLPVNWGLLAKGNASEVAPLREQIEAGACGLKVHEDWGATPAVIDAALPGESEARPHLRDDRPRRAIDAVDKDPDGVLSFCLPFKVSPSRSSRKIVTTRRISASADGTGGNCRL